MATLAGIFAVIGAWCVLVALILLGWIALCAWSERRRGRRALKLIQRHPGAYRPPSLYSHDLDLRQRCDALGDVAERAWR